MVNISVSDLEKELTIFYRLIENYETEYLNLFNELNKSESFWVDNRAKRYYREIEIEKQKHRIFYQDLKECSSVYEYLVTKYKEIGDKIHCNLNTEERVIEIFNMNIDKILGIMRRIRNLDTSFAPREREMLNRQHTVLSDSYKALMDARHNARTMYGRLREIEQEAKARIEKLDIKHITEFPVGEFV